MKHQEMASRVFKDWFCVPVSLLTLVTFVVAQSVYEVLASNPEFLTVRQVSHGRLLEIIIVFNLVPALLLFLLWATCRRLHTGLARVFLSAVYFFLFLGFFLQVHNAYLKGWEPFPYGYLLWAVPAGFLAFASLRFENSFRSFLLALSPVVLIFPGLFLFRTWTATKAWSPTRYVAVPQTVPSTGKKSFPPIFLLIFDEFTEYALLDDNGQIDGARFPNFKKLASESYWFRNATANAEYSIESLPVILTGNFPHGDDSSRDPYANNLFTLLQPYYDIYAYELTTHFCRPELNHCSDTKFTLTQIQLLKDVFYLYAARVLPQSAHINLPNFSRTWGPFQTRKEELAAHLKRFQRIVDSLASSRNDNVFYFVHDWLPHSPYMLTTEGRIYETDPSAFDPGFAENRALLKALRDNYLMQVGYVDRQLGSFLDRLRQRGLYDKAVIIVTSDHGVSWKPEAPGRALSKKNAEMILAVPLLIKTPFQKRGVVADRDVQHIDVMPTVAALLGLQVPWQHVGRSVFEPNVGTRQKVAYDQQGTRLEFPESFGLTRLDVRLLDEPRSPLIGQDIETFDVDAYEEIDGFLDLVPASHFRIESERDDFPVYVGGWAVLVGKASVPEQIAVAVNGKIVAVTSPRVNRPDIVDHYQNWKFLRSGWSIAFSSRQLREGVNAVTAYVVLDAEKKKLAMLKAVGNNLIQRTKGEVPEKSPMVGSEVKGFDTGWYATAEGYLDPLPTSPVSTPSEGNDLPVEVHGWAVLLDQGSVPEQIAVALNGEIVAVTSPCCDRPDVVKHLGNRHFLRSGWWTTFSSRKLRKGENRVTAYTVLDAKRKKLAILKTIENTIQTLPR